MATVLGSYEFHDWSLLEGFDAHVQEVFRLISRHGIDQVGAGDPADPVYFAAFLAAVHEGWRKAQLEIIAGLLSIERYAAQLEQARKKGSKKEREEARAQQKSLQHKEAIVRRLADAIAWQMIDHALWFARRINTDDPPPSISSSNLETHLAAANHLMQDSPTTFALLTDLTSFIRLGDLLVVSHPGKERQCQIVEIKEGTVNEELLPMAQHLVATRCPHLVPAVESARGKGMAAQLERMARQIEKLGRVDSLVRNSVGIDAHGDRVVLSEETIALASYADYLSDMINQSSGPGWAIGEVDQCLYLGAYRGQMREPVAFERWMQGCGIDGPIISLATSFRTTLSTPLFASPFINEHAVDIAMGRVLVLMCLAVEPFLKLVEAHGIKHKWLSRGETADVQRRWDRQMFEWKGRAIELEFGSERSIIGNALLGRIFYEFTTPQAAIELLGSNLAMSPERRARAIEAGLVPPEPSGT